LPNRAPEFTHRISREPVQKGQFPNGFTGQQQVFLTKNWLLSGTAAVRGGKEPAGSTPSSRVKI